MNMRTGVASAATVLVGLVLTACGSDGSGEGDAADSGQGGEMSAQEMELAWTECMREEGVDVPDPDVDDGGVVIDMGDLPEEEFAAAADKCDDKVPFGSDDLMDEETYLQFELEFAECMRDEGVDYPDPVPGSESEIPFPEDDEAADAFEAAEEKCSEQVSLDPGADAV